MTTVADDPTASLIDPPKTMAAAVSYLRVSTREQAQKGGTDEGFSIPAQREATRRKAEQLGAGIVEEFVDAGASAKSSDRPELMRMIQYVKANKVAYCIVHKVDRLARNRADDVSIHLALQQCGVMLVSASENIDETPSGMLLHGIMSTIAEFYSRNLATEVAKGMNQKAIGGGTNGRAPIGYLNVRKRDELGREVRTIELDPERAPMIEWAFKAYASGNWSVSQLHDELTSRGLRSLPTPKRPAKPLAVSTIHRLLTNPYYKGDVIYRGTRYKGNHPALVSAEVWYQVQSVLTAHQCAVEATQVHGHYLKGTIHCGQCGSRLIVSNAKNRHGNVYCYFVCSGRHSKRTDCTRQAMLIEDVEKLVEDYYTRVQITHAQQDALAGMLHHEFDRLMAAETEELERLTTNRDRLESEQDRLMQAHYADAIPLTVLKREQDRIVAELDQVTRRIDAHFGDYADARAHLDDALGLLANCADIYRRCDDTNRRLCNQAFFTKVFIDEDNELRVEHNRPFEMLLDPQVNANALTWAADANKARTSASVAVGKGSSLVRGVDLRREFDNFGSAARTVCSRWSQGVYRTSKRPSEPCVVDSRGQSVRSLEMAQTFLTDAEVDELVAGYEAGATPARAGQAVPYPPPDRGSSSRTPRCPYSPRGSGFCAGQGRRPAVRSWLDARAAGPPVRGGRADRASNHRTSGSVDPARWSTTPG
nr:recombinase family protein [Propionicimonas sp.]